MPFLCLFVSAQGLNAALFYENKDPRTFVSLVPTSAHSGDGMGNLISLLVELTQTMLARRLAHCDELRAQVMEVRLKFHSCRKILFVYDSMRTSNNYWIRQKHIKGEGYSKSSGKYLGNRKLHMLSLFCNQQQNYKLTEYTSFSAFAR